MDSHIIKMKNGRYKPVAKTLSMWSRKVVCECGHSFVRNKINCPNGDSSYYFYCNSKSRNKSDCKISRVPQWKLELMSKVIFNHIFNERKEIANKIKKIANEYLNEDLVKEALEKDKNKLDNNLELEKNKLNKLLNMYLNNQIEKDKYMEYSKIIDNKIKSTTDKIYDLEYKLKNLKPIEEWIENINKVVNSLINFDNDKIDEDLIEEVIDKIIVHKDYYEWKLKYTDKIYKLNVVGRIDDDLRIVWFD